MTWRNCITAQRSNHFFPRPIRQICVNDYGVLQVHQCCSQVITLATVVATEVFAFSPVLIRGMSVPLSGIALVLFPIHKFCNVSISRRALATLAQCRLLCLFDREWPLPVQPGGERVFWLAATPSSILPATRRGLRWLETAFLFRTLTQFNQSGVKPPHSTAYATLREVDLGVLRLNSPKISCWLRPSCCGPSA